MRVSKFTGAIVAGAIAITSAFATPASAASDGDRLATILLGAAAVGLAVHTIKKKKKEKSHATVARHNAYRPRDSRAVYNQHRPKNCLRKKYTNHGWETYYSRKCLKNHRNRHNHGYSEANHHNHNRYDDNHGRRNNHGRYNNHRRHNNHYQRDGFYEFQRRANDKK